MKNIYIKIILTNIIVLFLSIDNIYSQSNWCGTVFSDQDKEYVEGIMNSSLKSAQLDNGVKYFRIKHHIVRDDNGNDGLSPDVIPGIMSTLNNVYSASDIQFYSCDSPEFIDSTYYYYLDNGVEEQSLTNTYNDSGAINIYYFSQMINGSYSYTYPSGEINFIGINNGSAPNGSTIPHEMGHFFGLLHTWEGYSTPVTNSMELVTRGTGRNCETAGDRLCDTPADPYIDDDVVNTSCTYTGTARDFNNVAYAPDVSNFMAYSRKVCRNHFSDDQNEIISALAASTDKQVFIHKTAIANNSNLNGNTTNDFITVTNSTINSGANVVLDACQEIEISSNFEVKVGATFEAR